MIKYYINLTNGIEWIPELEGKPFNYIRIQSTTLENNDWTKLFRELDYNFLMDLATGKRCLVLDTSAHKQVGKVIYHGIPLITAVLDRFWYGRQTPYTVKGNDHTKIFEVQYQRYFHRDKTKEKEQVKSKLRYFNKFLTGDKVLLQGNSFQTENDNKHDFYTKIVKDVQKT